MKKMRQVQEKNKSNRLLFFDILRILFVAIIVYDHSQFFLIPWFNSLFFSEGQNLFNIYINGLTGFAVYGMIFVSGAVLQYTYREVSTSADYKTFLLKRLVRIYPAFWMSLLLGILLFPFVIQGGLFPLIMEFTGFYVILGQGPGIINIMGWFIAAIVCLYVLFPWLSKFLKKYGFIALIILLLISYVSRYLFYTDAAVFGNLTWRWFPLCNLFEFSLGIYCIQKAFYPKNTQSYPVINWLAELSFYVFLFHTVIIFRILPLLPKEGAVSTGIICYFAMMSAVIIVSWIAMVIDRAVQRNLRQRKFFGIQPGS